MSQLPRLNRKAVATSANLNDYTIFLCADDEDATEAAGTKPAAGERCVVAYGYGDPSSAMSKFQAGASDSKDPLNFVEGILGYAAFGVLCALLCILFALIFCIARSCCCCVRGGGCGKRYPTYAMSAFRLGFTEVDAPLLAGGKAAPGAGQRTELAYPLRARWLVRFLMYTYVALVVAFVVVGHQRGNVALTDSLKTIGDSPSGFMQTVRCVARLSVGCGDAARERAADRPYLLSLQAGSSHSSQWIPTPFLPFVAARAGASRRR